MIPDKRFLRQPKRFWANVRLLSQHIGYTERAGKSSGKIKSVVKVPTISEISGAFLDLDLC
jgi:hypothetical protein